MPAFGVMVSDCANRWLASILRALPRDSRRGEPIIVYAEPVGFGWKSVELHDLATDKTTTLEMPFTIEQ